MDYIELERVIKESGMKRSAIADKIKVNRCTFYLKVSGKREFSQKELMALKEVLNLDNDEFIRIFFNHDVGKMPTVV